MCVAAVAALLISAGLAPAARASTSVVDGVADQNMGLWDGEFARFFRSAWVGSPPTHLRFARYALQWNVFSAGGSEYQVRFERWLAAVAELGLAPVIAPTTFNATRPAEALGYGLQLEAVLQHADQKLREKGGPPIAYVEPWNEPNNQGGYPNPDEAATPAGFANEANAICMRLDCTVIAGDFEDSSNVAAYLDEYRAHLTFSPTRWGVHPYQAITFKEGKYSAAHLEELEQQLAEGAAELWYTEAGVYYCKKGENRSSLQDADAQRLNHLIATKHPAHVFYYQFEYKEGMTLPCAPNVDDTFLYAPSGARSAASVIFGPAAPTP